MDKKQHQSLQTCKDYKGKAFLGGKRQKCVISLLCSTLNIEFTCNEILGA